MEHLPILDFNFELFLVLIELVDLTEAPRTSFDMIILEPITNACEFRIISFVNLVEKRL
jgi:hypothetical protein